MQDSTQLKENFLKKDFRDALKWLFVGAVTWQAHPLERDKDYLRGLGMFTSLVQARALYEFFYKSDANCDVSKLQPGCDARAKHFVDSWQEPADDDGLYANYMAARKPAQRRVFHLVYGRETSEGGGMGGGSDELNSRVLDFARHLKRVTEDFAMELKGNPERDRYRELVECALAKALVEACELAKTDGIFNSILSGH